jgi:hypothetical protein
MSSNTKWIRLTNESGLHNGVQYKEGRVDDPLPWNPDQWLGGGIYFCHIDDILEWINYMEEPIVWAWDVTIPDDAHVAHFFQESKASSVILSNRRHVADLVDPYKKEHKMIHDAICQLNCDQTELKKVVEDLQERVRTFIATQQSRDTDEYRRQHQAFTAEHHQVEEAKDRLYARIEALEKRSADLYRV